MKPKKRYKSVNCGSHTFKIVYKKCVINPETNQEVLGICNAMINTITISTCFRGENLGEEMMEHSLFHEFEHLKLIMLNKWRLNNDEGFVDTMGMLNAQIFKTLK